MQTSGFRRLRVTLSAFAIVAAPSILALAPGVAGAATPMKHDAATTAPMAMPAAPAMSSGMSEADHAQMHAQMAADHADMHQAMPMEGEMPMHHMSHTGNVDQDFAANMRMHDAMGIKMAQAQLKNGHDPEMMRMAKDVLAAQQPNVTALDKWIKAHESAPPAASPKS